MKYLALSLLLLAGCASTGPKIPDTQLVEVQTRRPLPEWAKVQPPKPAPADTVQEHLQREAELEAIVDGYACRVLLLIQLDLDKAVDPDSCK